MRGEPCWGFAGGHAPSLEIGAKVPAKRPLTNPALSEDVRRHVAEFSVFAMCPWELWENASFMCSWTDDETPDGTIERGLAKLVGRKVIGAMIRPPFWTIEIRFEGGLTFRTTHDDSPEAADMECYDLFTPELVYGVFNDGRIETEPREFL